MAAKRPLLLLPRPARAEVDSSRGGKKPKNFGRATQAARLSAAFDRIFATSQELRSDPSGVPPEKVLVLETFRTVSDDRQRNPRLFGHRS